MLSGKLLLDFSIKYTKNNLELNLELKNKALVLGILGKSGSGKTTLLNLISGLIIPDEGYININDRIIYNSNEKINLPVSIRKIGYIFQDNQLFPHLNIKKNLLFAYKKNNSNKFNFLDIVELLKIDHLLDRKPYKLSGGEKKRVAIGRAILSNPDLILMDEPLTGLDKDLKKEVLGFIRNIIQVSKIPIVYVSHQINEVLEITNNIYNLEQGYLIKLTDIFSKKINESSSKILESDFKNFIEVDIIENDQNNNLSTVSFQKNKKINNFKIPFQNKRNSIKLSVSPKDIAISLTFIPKTSIQNQTKGIILNIINLERTCLIKIDIGVIIYSEISKKSLIDLDLKIKSEIYCLIKSSSFLVH